MPEPSSSAHRRRVSTLAVVTALGGLALLALTIRRVGWNNVVAGVASVGWAFAVVVALGALRAAARSQAWVLCARGVEPGARLSFVDALNAFLAADALGNVTPLGLLASEPVKVLMVRSKVSMVTSLASVAIENAAYTFSVLVVLLTGVWMLSQRANLPTPLEQAATIVVAGAVIGGVATLWAARTRPAILSRFGPLLAKISGGSETPAESLREVEHHLYDALSWPVSRLAGISAWQTLFHFLAIGEVWLVLRLLPGGSGATLGDAFLMESAGRFVTVVFKFIPFRLGVDEAGSGIVAQVVGIPAAAGVTLALVRRLRIFVLNGLGLVILARRR